MDNTININTNSNSNNTTKTEVEAPPAEEYKLEDAFSTSETGDYPPEQQPPEQSKISPVKEFIQRIRYSKFKRLLIPIGLIIAIFILYQVLGLFSQKKRSVEEMTPQSKITAVSAPSSTPRQAQFVPPVISPIEEKVIEELKTVASQEKQDINVMSRVEGMVKTQQAALVSLNNNLNKSLGDLSLSVSILAKNVETLIAAKAAKQKVEKPKKKKVARVIHKNVYHVKAIVPGRAWLEDSHGMTVTVRIGDIINKGKVEIISPKQGIVVTSSGEVIQYGDNDI